MSRSVIGHPDSDWDVRVVCSEMAMEMREVRKPVSELILLNKELRTILDTVISKREGSRLKQLALPCQEKYEEGKY